MTTALTTNQKSVDATVERQRLPVFTPPVDIYHNDDEFIVIVEMPGVNENSVDITLESGVLTIEGKGARPSMAGLRCTHSEAPNGNYRRVFRLAEDVDIEKSDAKMKDGVLTLKLPKHEKARARKIAVRAE